MSVLLLHSKQFDALGALVMGPDGMDGIFKEAVSHKLDVSTLFHAISGFKRIPVIGLDRMKITFKGGEISPRRNSCIIVGVLSLALISSYFCKAH